MLQNVIDVGTTADFGNPLSMTSDKGSYQPADTTSFGLLRVAAMLQDVFKGFFEIEQTTWPRISEQDAPLLELVEALKERTETHLGGTIVNISASFPVFFNATHKASLTTALTQAGLHDSGCHPDGNAMGTALTASSVAHSNCPRSNFECAHGPSSSGWVLAVEYTDMALSAALFESLVGYTASFLRDGTYFIEVKPANDAAAATEDQSFWDIVRSQMLDLIKQRPHGNDISRLFVFGTSSHDQQLHEILSETVGDLLTFGRLRQAGSYHRVSTGHDSSTLQVSAQPNNAEDNVDPIFAAARGATLYGLQSVLEPCLQPCSILACEEKRGRVRLWETFLEKLSEGEEEWSNGIGGFNSPEFMGSLSLSQESFDGLVQAS